MPKKPPFPWKAWVAAAIVVGILYGSAVGTEFNGEKLATGFPKIGKFLSGLFPFTGGKPWDMAFFKTIQSALLETIRIAFSASFLGALAALPYALVGARTLAITRWVYNAGRAWLNLVRSVPDLVLAFLVTVCIGFGALAGFVTLFVFSFGVVAKLLCDTIETIDPGPMEAITAAGGTHFQRARYAVFPQVAPDFISYLLYAFEINIRAAAVLGVVGAGGIGFILKSSMGRYNYAEVGMIITVTFLVVLAIDALSTWLRGKLV
jgi:phosphonate transport system permease protein